MLAAPEMLRLSSNYGGSELCKDGRHERNFRMKDGPIIAPVAALAGDPARANMLVALSDGKALTASELANEAGITAQTASSHLAKLETGGFMLETMMGVAARAGHVRTRPGPSDPAMRKARMCYDHLAGEMGVQMLDGLIAHGHIANDKDTLSLTRKGEAFLKEFGIDVDALDSKRRPLCRTCLDWSMRRAHLSGAVGGALLEKFYDLDWAKRDRKSRAVIFNPRGEKKFREAFRIS
jgi:DNA-binding MarR family transcriptional regulator